MSALVRLMKAALDSQASSFTANELPAAVQPRGAHGDTVTCSAFHSGKKGPNQHTQLHVRL
jgi:hypothetical protein